MTKYLRTTLAILAVSAMTMAGFACSKGRSTTTSSQMLTPTTITVSTATQPSTSTNILSSSPSSTTSQSTSYNPPPTSTIMTMTAPQTTLTTPPPTTSAQATPTNTGMLSNVVYVADYSFTPAVITVPAGSQVTWINSPEDEHTVTSDIPGIFDNALAPGGRTTIIFNIQGTYNYHCSIHLQMTGTVIVTG